MAYSLVLNQYDNRVKRHQKNVKVFKYLEYFIFIRWDIILEVGWGTLLLLLCLFSPHLLLFGLFTFDKGLAYCDHVQIWHNEE